MAILFSDKNRYTASALLFLVLVFLAVFFCRKALDPTLSSYKDHFSQISIFTPPDETNTHISMPPELPVESELNIDDSNVKMGVQIKSDPDADHRSSDTASDKRDDTLVEEKVKCDFYDGTWVRDEGYPIYEPGSCPYVDEAYDCQSTHRHSSLFPSPSSNLA